MIKSRFQLITVCAAAAALILTPWVAAEEAATSPLVSIESVTVTPESPPADTLCRLSVTLKNGGEQVASQLAFRVTINGDEVPVYGNQIWMFPLEPGATSEVALFNFWSTETARSMPKDGKLRVEVSLIEAQWTKIEDVEGVETWTPLGAVPGLPVSKLVTLQMTR